MRRVAAVLAAVSSLLLLSAPSGAAAGTSDGLDPRVPSAHSVIYREQAVIATPPSTSGSSSPTSLATPRGTRGSSELTELSPAERPSTWMWCWEATRCTPSTRSSWSRRTPACAGGMPVGTRSWSTASAAERSSNSPTARCSTRASSCSTARSRPSRTSPSASTCAPAWPPKRLHSSGTQHTSGSVVFNKCLRLNAVSESAGVAVHGVTP